VRKEVRERKRKGEVGDREGGRKGEGMGKRERESEGIKKKG
jgi:hypothetical protein